MQKFLTTIERRLHQFIDLPEPVVPQPDRFGIAMVCIARNEEKYIQEWIEFHRIVGIRHFYIYVNDRPGHMYKTTLKYITKGLVTLIPWENHTMVAAPQTLAYAHALRNYGRHYRWMVFIDVDEFLFPVKQDCLLEALEPFDDLSGLSIPWHMYGTSGHKTPPKGLIVENFNERAPFPPRARDHQLIQYKSIVDPGAVFSMKNSHWFYKSCGHRAAYNERKQYLTTISEHMPRYAHSDIFRLNHYFTRSESDINAKLLSGRADRPGAPIGVKFKRTQKIWKMIERRPVKDTAIHRFLPRLKQRQKR